MLGRRRKSTNALEGGKAVWVCTDDRDLDRIMIPTNPKVWNRRKYSKYEPPKVRRRVWTALTRKTVPYAEVPFAIPVGS